MGKVNELKEEEEKADAFRMSKISILLDDYNDLFSDFDPRHYSERALSDDFLIEAKKASADKTSGNITLNFLIPSKLRKTETEKIIKRRLREHFKKHFNFLQNEIRKIVTLGVYFVIFGLFLMFLATLLLIKFPVQTLFKNFLVVVFEPAGWFFFWEGLNQIIFEAKTKKPDLEFYRKMSQCEITFLDY
jgi:Fe2+ transport system protein B